MAPSSKRLGHRSFKAAVGVRVPLGPFFFIFSEDGKWVSVAGNDLLIFDMF